MSGFIQEQHAVGTIGHQFYVLTVQFVDLVVVVVDVENRRLDIEIDQTELLKRQSSWKPPKIDYPAGALSKYAKLVSSASDGAVTL